MTTGDDIRTARQRAGLTQAELAQQIGVSMRTVGNWERGDTPPNRYAARINAVLDGLINSAERPSIEDYSDAALLAEIARRFDSTRSIRERSTDQPRPATDDHSVEGDALSDGATTRTSGPGLRLLSDDVPDLRDQPYAADREEPGDDPGEDHN